MTRSDVSGAYDLRLKRSLMKIRSYLKPVGPRRQQQIDQAGKLSRHSRVFTAEIQIALDPARPDMTQKLFQIAKYRIDALSDLVFIQKRKKLFKAVRHCPYPVSCRTDIFRYPQEPSPDCFQLPDDLLYFITKTP